MLPNDPRELLKSYSEQRATVESVMRGLALHRGWYVPAWFAAGRLNNPVSEHSIILSAEFETQPARLLLFTDEVAAHRAEGQRIGIVCRAGFSGSQIFAALDESFEAVSINPWSRAIGILVLPSGRILFGESLGPGGGT